MKRYMRPIWLAFFLSWALARESRLSQENQNCTSIPLNSSSPLMTSIRIELMKKHVEVAQAQLDPQVPFITSENWVACSDQGWRRNLDHRFGNLLEIIKSLQIRHGKENVTLGWRFPLGEQFPVEDPEIITTYIRDGDDQIKEFHELMQSINPEALINLWAPKR